MEYEKCNTGMDNRCTMGTSRLLYDHNGLNMPVTKAVMTLWMSTMST